jgi:hypothetical protein
MFLFGVAALMAQSGDPLPPDPVGRLVDIGGRKLHLDCVGLGNPTVILVHGAGAFSFDWGLVQPKVGTFGRVCSYVPATPGVIRFPCRKHSVKCPPTCTH